MELHFVISACTVFFSTFKYLSAKACNPFCCGLFFERTKWDQICLIRNEVKHFGEEMRIITIIIYQSKLNYFIDILLTRIVHAHACQMRFHASHAKRH